MKYTEQQIVSEVIAHMGKYEGRFPDWYVGVVADARTRLFSEHSVNETGDAWICRQCDSNVEAREIERYFTKKGCKGGPVDEEQSVRFFYAYMIQPHTHQ